MWSYEELERTHQETDFFLPDQQQRPLYTEMWPDPILLHQFSEGAVGDHNDGISMRKSDHESEIVFLLEYIPLIPESFEECIMGKSPEDSSWVG